MSLTSSCRSLDDGRLTDGQGRTVDFKNTVIIMTSNVGSMYPAGGAPTHEGELRRGSPSRDGGATTAVQAGVPEPCG